MRIGILECGRTLPEVEKKHGGFPDMFATLLADRGFHFTAYHVENMEFPSSVRDQDGWLLTGSKHGAYEDHPFIPPLEDFIRKAYGAAIPMVGICFGHQIIAQALGGRVEKFRGGWGVGRHTYSLDGKPVHLNAWHQDQVTALPDGAEVVGSSPFCRNAALVYDTRAFTVQAHPEFSGPLVADYVALRRGTSDYPDDRMDAAVEAAALPVDNAILAERISSFFLAALDHLNLEQTHAR